MRVKRSAAARQLLNVKMAAYAFGVLGALQLYMAGDAASFSGQWWIGMVGGLLQFLLGLSLYGDWRVLRYVASPQNEGDLIIVRGHEAKVYEYQAKMRRRVQKMEAKAR